MTGTGTQTDPYIVMNYTDLCSMKGGSSTYYRLGADIDFAQTDRKSTDGAILIGFKELFEFILKTLLSPFVGRGNILVV